MPTLVLPVEHILLLVQIVIGLRLIVSLKAWLRQLDTEMRSQQKLASDDPLARSGRTSSSAEFRARDNQSGRSSDLGSAGGAERLLELDDVSLPGPPHEWRTRPVMLRIATGKQQGQQVEFNLPSSAFAVETDLFEGKMYFRLRGCAHEPKDYFFGKQRRLSAVVQGRFKQPLVMGECFTGYEFRRPFSNVPAPFLIRAGLSFIRTLAPTLREDILGARPYFLNPLCQTIQVLHISEPGKEPNLTDPTLHECNAKLGGIFAERRVDRVKRKHYFANPTQGARHVFDPGLVYTMEFYEDKFDPACFDLMLIGLRFNLSRYLGAQPLQIMGKHGDVPHGGSYLFNVEMWHESLLGPWNPERSPPFGCL